MKPPLRVHVLADPALVRPEGPCALSPYQQALLRLVYGERQISREAIADMLWPDDASGRTRHRIRQLKTEIRRRAGSHLLESENDRLAAHRTVTSDLQDFEALVAASSLLEAATLISSAEAPNGAPGALLDWWHDLVDRCRRRVLQASEAKWNTASAQRKWSDARDAAEAWCLLRPGDPPWTARLIEGRARDGRLQAAEVAYAEFIDTFPHVTDSDRVHATIARVREVAAAGDTSASDQPTPFVGREEVLRALGEQLTEVRKGRFTFSLVVGEAGIGKTRLLGELERSALLEGFRCLRAEPVEFERRIAMNPLLDALSAVDLEPHLRSLGEPWRTVIGTMLPPGPLSQSVKSLPPIEERGLSRRLLDSFSLLLRSIAEEQPTVLFLDDLQWADETTIATLQFFSRRWTGSFFGVVATVRPEAVSTKHPATAFLRDEAKLDVRRIPLSELNAREARLLVGLLGGERINDPDAAKLCALSGGHPLYLTELTSDYLAARFTLPASEADASSIPISIRQILLARLEGASDDARALLNLLSVSGTATRITDLSKVLDQSLDRTADAAAELSTRELAGIERDRIWIPHELFRAAIYRELSEAHRAVLHQRIADHFRNSSGDEAASELAIHLERAGQLELAVKYGWIAARRAFERGAVAEAAHFYELVTRNETNEAEQANATALLATALHLNRDISRATPALELASSRLRAVGHVGHARRMDIRRVEGLAEMGDTPVDELVARLKAIEGEARRAEDWEAVALALDVELGLHYLSGQGQAMQQTLEAMRIVSERGLPDAKALCYAGLAMNVLFGDADEGLLAARTAVRITEKARTHRLKALLRLMVVLQLRGRLQQADASPIVAELRGLAKSSGDVRIRFSVESNVAVALLDAGELDQAEAQLDLSTNLLGSADMDLNRFNQANNYAELALARQDYHQAHERFLEAASYLGQTIPPFGHDLVHAGLGLCELHSGKLRSAQRRLESIRLGPPWQFDPTTIIAFASRMLELRKCWDEADELMRVTADELEGRLELAWLKVCKLRVEKALRWSRAAEVDGLSEKCEALCQELSLTTRASEFAILSRHLSHQ